MDDDEINDRIDSGFKAMSTLSLVSKQSARSSVHITEKGDHVKVRIIVTSFLHEQLPSTSEYNYHYRVQVENIGRGDIQLCGRHWVFHNSQGVEESVVPKYAHGVIGATPVISAGHAVQYMSQCYLSTESGVMAGDFLFSDLDGEELFEAKIEK